MRRGIIARVLWVLTVLLVALLVPGTAVLMLVMVWTDVLAGQTGRVVDSWFILLILAISAWAAAVVAGEVGALDSGVRRPLRPRGVVVMKDLPHNHFTIGVVEGCPACEQVAAALPDEEQSSE